MSPFLPIVSRRPATHRDRAAAGLVLALAVAACTPVVAPDTPRQAIGCSPQLLSRLYFGLDTPHGPVSEASWQDFVDQVVTPRFDDGLTVLEASGQWRDRQGTTSREPARVIEIVHVRSIERQQRLAEIVGRYKARFHQQVVLVTQTPVHACL